MLSIVIRDLLCNIVQSLPGRRARPNLTKIDSMEVRTLLAADFGPSSTTTPTFQHYKVDAADAPQVPSSGTSLRQNLNGSGLQFNFVTTGTVPQQVIDGFVAAGKLWSDVITDDIVVNVQIGYSALGPGILGQTGSTSESISYSSFRTNLIADSKSTDDATAVSHLPAGPSLSLYTSSYTNGSPGAPFIDNNNSTNNNFLDLNTAQSKALGLRTAGNTTFDAQMTFSSDFTWDFDRSNGISPNAFDFVGVAAHEIGHALGFVSGADWVDYSTGFGPVRQNLDSAAVASGLDLFRFSASSISNGTNLDLRADTVTKFFSIDGGTTSLTTFSTGSYNGDGNQASHWKDDLGIGIMDPTLDFGELPVITALDIKAFDVMGWDIRSDSGTNTAPVVNNQNLPNLDENVTNGTVVGTVAASDNDLNQQLTYSIVGGNTGNAFAINPTTGQITVNNRLAVDYDTNPVFQLTVQVTDNGSPSKSDTGVVTIALNNLNDLDFGDLPDSYRTLLASNGPRHQTGSGLFLGSGVTNELNGQPGTTSTLDIDDGVTVPGILTPGSNAQFTVTASQTARLDVFIDFNANGVFDSTERVTSAGGLIVNAGSNVVTVSVPINATAGQRGARFRLSSIGGLNSTGLAPDGEVEDYFVTMGPAGPAYDFGDLPDTFSTILASDGARHRTGGGLLLGTGVTSDTDGKPSTAANQDNDDGVIYPAAFTLGNSALLNVRASRAGKLDAFIDFNGNGVFDANERVTPEGGLALVPGVNSVTVNIPASAVAGQRGARFRLSTAGGLAATGQAADGEVEDYFVRLASSGPAFDFGDLPDTFGTLLSSNGPRHQLGSDLTLGYAVTTDAVGQPNALANGDADDGVKLNGLMSPGSLSEIEVTASKTGKLDAFVDFNGNGQFDANERVTPAGGQTLTAGANIVRLTVPSNASIGQLGARFRISTVGGLGALGSAVDGEVEDYFVTVAGTDPTYDFGDLPNTFGTTLASNGARHQTGGGLFLGTAATSEADGQPNATANLDADDGVTAPASLSTGVNAQFTVKASQAGKLDAFIDFNGNGVFDTNERVTPTGGLAVVTGNNTVTVSVPSNAVIGQRGARFRLSTAGGLAALGQAADGEVEDYFVTVTGPPTYDFGDLPNTFGTLLANDGARHLTGGGLFLGTGVTNETDGKPSATASLDTDDGVTAPASLAPRMNAQFTVTASKAGKLDAFIDFNGNGVFESTERVTPTGGQSLVAGQNTVNVTVPDTAVAGQRAARFRISTTGGLAATGLAADGEVEDYFVNVVRYDYGDLPNTFGTTLASDGARHQVGGGLFLGTAVTGEPDGLPSAQANQDSDDGVIFSSTLISGLGARMNVIASQAGKLDAFIDFNGNGVFDANERVTPAGGLSLAAGENSFVVPVPETTAPGQKAARFRLSSAGGLSAKGVAANGEVEDYFVNVVSPAEDTIQLLPDPDSPGQQLIYIRGTTGNDTISVEKTNLGFVVRMNNKVSPDLNANSRILIYGGEGKDKITLPTSIPLPAIVDGGPGNDSLWGGNGNDLLLGGNGDDEIYARGGLDTVYGGQGNDTIIGDAKTHVMFGEDGNDKITGHGILVGGIGQDTLRATGSRNVLIGGEGADQLTAAVGGDLLIGGTTNFDTNSTALRAILDEWSAAIAVNTRIAHLTGSQSGGLNGSFYLVSDAVRPGTVHNDFAVDTIINTFAEDWLLLFSGDRRSSLAGILNHS